MPRSTAGAGVGDSVAPGLGIVVRHVPDGPGTAWTAIDHAAEEHGCLRFVPGTRRWGRRIGKEPHVGIRLDDVEPFDADLLF